MNWNQADGNFVLIYSVEKKIDKKKMDNYFLQHITSENPEYR